MNRLRGEKPLVIVLSQGYLWYLLEQNHFLNTGKLVDKIGLIRIFCHRYEHAACIKGALEHLCNFYAFFKSQGGIGVHRLSGNLGAVMVLPINKIIDGFSRC